MIMQENRTDELRLTARRRYTTKEERELHLEKWKKSGLTMSEYCRQNNMPLSKLSEWKRTLLQKPTKFKSIKLSSPISEAMIKSSNIIEIIVDQRIKIRLQQSSDTSLLINIVKGLMICS
jgi:hypothetical protein